MNILNIAFKEIRSTLRNKQSFLFMLALPIVLMLVLGTALSSAFSSGLKIDDLSLLYKNSATQSPLNDTWTGFAQAIEQEGVKLTPLSANQDGRAEVSEDHYTGYAEISDDGIHYYGGSKHTIESDIIQGMLTAFTARYNLLSAALKEDPASVATIMASTTPDFVQETSLNSDKQPGSFDYYAIGMSTMIAFYACIPASLLMGSERTRNTAIRLLASPIAKGEIFLGKVLGCTITNFLFVISVFLFSKYLYHAEWGTHYGSILLVLFSEVLLAVSFGLACSYLFKGEGGRSAIMIFTQIASFLGGAYFPVDNTGFMGIASHLSPLRWANQALTGIIYSNDWSATWSALLLNTGVAAAFLFLAVILMRRQEAL